MDNIFETHEIDKKINYLSQKWIEAKELEDKYRQTRISIEEEILKTKEIDPSIPKTSKLDNGLVVSCKLKRDWDQNFLKENMDVLNQLGEACPFEIEFKENKKKMDALKLYNKEAYSAFQRGLDLRPIKPAFSMKGEIK